MSWIVLAILVAGIIIAVSISSSSKRRIEFEQATLREESLNKQKEKVAKGWTELYKVYTLSKKGKTTKEIASALNITTNEVEEIKARDSYDLMKDDFWLETTKKNFNL